MISRWIELSSPEIRGHIDYLSKLPDLDKKIRVAFDWTLDLLFPKDVCAVYDLDNSRDFEKDNIQLGPPEASEGCALVERV